MLKEAIRDFDGTVIVVSHDREFLDGLVSRIYSFGGGKVREHLGGIYDWLQQAPHTAPEGASIAVRSAGTASSNELSCPTRGAKGGPEPTSAAASYAEQKAQKRALKRLEDHVKSIEAEMNEVNAAIAILEANMDGSDPSAYERYDRLKKKQEQLESDWLEASEELENAKI